MAAPKIGTGVMDVVFDPAQIAKAGQETVVPSAKRLAADVASAFVGVKLLDFGRQGLDELKAAAAAQSNVEAVIRSTGGAANVTAEDVDELANSQLKLTGVDDEVIKQGAAKLLTFKEVANQVGEGNDVFDRATKASLDMAQIGFGSVESASVLLGKALNDPVKGVTALQRVGVALTDSQKAQVAAFVESGDVLSAQKVILAEVESQVGGAAAAYGKTLPGQIDIAEQSLENMKGQLVAGAAPALRFGANAVEFLADKFDELPEGAQAAVGGLVILGGSVAALSRPVADLARVYDVWRARQEAAAAAATVVAAAQTAATTSTEVNTAASLAANEADIRRIVSNQALPGFFAARAVAEQEVAVAQVQRIISNDALIASEEALVAADAAAVVGAQSVAVASGTASAALGPVGLIGAAAAAVVGLVVVGNAMGGTKNSAVDATSAVNAYSQALDEAGDKKVDPQQFLDEATLDLLTGASAPEGLTGVAKDLQDAGVGLGSFFSAVRDGTGEMDELASNTELAKRQANALVDETKGHDLGDQLRDAAAGGSELAAGLLRARESGKLTDDRIQEIIKTANDLSGGLDTARTKSDVATAGMAELGGAAGGAEGAIDGVNEAALEGPDDEHAKALASWYEAIRKNADDAFAATLKLAPADIRAREGRIAIANANDKVTEAEQKLENLRRMGTPEQIADAERDLESARLTQQTAVLNEADALVELERTQREANGQTLTAKEAADLHKGALQLLNTELTGPAHDAMAVHIFDLQVAINKTDELYRLQQIMAGAAPSLFIPGGGSDIGPRPSTGPIRARASGGPVGPGEVFRGGEKGFEVLLTDGLYKAPPKAATVLNHQQSVEFMGSAPVARGGINIEGDIIVQGKDAPGALRELPNELRAAAYTAV